MQIKDTLKKVDDTLHKSYVLQGHYQGLQIEKELVEKKVQDSKKWLAKQPDYLKFLQHLQSALHQKNIGAFSELLTYFVKDVLKKDKDIIFDLYTYHNLPALKIEALNDGCRESIYEGNGGSIANIVSTGLRLIALSRLQHRKFIVLDEPDCWLKPDHVPIFAKIIGEISEKLKIQTIIISHHDWRYFKDYGRVIELDSDGKNLNATIVHDTDFVEDENADYIRSIRLRQFMSHHDTEFQLHPYLTCLIGENDIGKSVLSTAIKAVAYNDSSDSYIKHHTEEAQVLFELNKKRQILWQRFEKTTAENPQKVKYSLFVDKVLIAAEFNSSEVPGFVSKELKILTTEDIDVHVGNQKQPVFMIGSDVKPQQRAKILSLGKESLLIQKMMETIKNKTRHNKQIVKEGEERFDVIQKQLNELSNVDELVKKAEEIKSEYITINENIDIIQSLAETLTNISAIVSLAELGVCDIDFNEPVIKDCEQLATIVEGLKVNENIGAVGILEHKITEPELNQTSELEKIVNWMIVAEKGSAIEKINGNLVEPALRNLDELYFIIDRLTATMKADEIEPIDYSVYRDVNLKDVTELKTIIDNLESSEHILADYEGKKNNLKLHEKMIIKEIEDFLELNKGICPTCHQQVSKEHFVGETHA